MPRLAHSSIHSEEPELSSYCFDLVNNNVKWQHEKQDAGKEHTQIFECKFLNHPTGLQHQIHAY